MPETHLADPAGIPCREAEAGELASEGGDLLPAQTGEGRNGNGWAARRSRRVGLRLASGALGRPKKGPSPARKPKVRVRGDRRAAALYPSLLASLGHAVVAIDRNREIVHFNRQAGELFGLEPADRTIRDLTARIAALCSDQVTPLVTFEWPMARVLDGGSGSDRELCLRCPGLSEVQWISASTRPLIAQDGTLIGAVGLYMRIEAFKQREVELIRARDAALATLQTRCEALAGMSHELRIPLNSIVGMARLLIDGRLSAEQREIAATLGSSAESLVGIVNQVLDLSRATAGKIDLERLAFKPIGTVGCVIEEMAEKARTKGIEIASVISGDVPVRALGDPARLRQVLTNLVGNAVKFTERGIVTIRLKADRVSRHEVLLEVRVQDTGIGIPLKARRHLFQSFAQGDVSTSRKYGGAGLGLAISARIVELMGGKIGFNSTEGKGSEFWFTARLGLQPHTRTLGEDISSTVGSRGVLLVGPQTPALTVLAEQLTSWGIACDLAAGHEQALGMLARRARSRSRYDLAIVDGGSNGDDAADFARQPADRKQARKMTVALMYPLGHRPDRRSPARADGRLWLAKPVRPSDLIATLGAVGKRRRARLTRGSRSGEDPRGQPPSFRQLRSRIPIAIRKRTRILVAEDHEVNRRVMLKMLERIGYHADGVGDGLEALAVLRRRSYDFLLLDCQMPEMDGYEASRLIRERAGRLHRIPIVGVTGHALKGDREKCIAAGMDDCLSKPVLPEELASAIEKFIMPSVGVRRPGRRVRARL